MTDYVTVIWKCRNRFKQTEERLNRQLERLALNRTCDTMTLAERLCEIVEKKRRLAIAAEALRRMSDALTGEESSVLSLVCKGESPSQIAALRDCSASHVRRTYASAFNKCAGIWKRKFGKRFARG